jgi:hypothetical protein
MRGRYMDRVSVWSLRIVVPVLMLTSPASAQLQWDSAGKKIMDSVTSGWGLTAAAVALVGGLLAWSFGGNQRESLLGPIYQYGSVAAMIYGAGAFVLAMTAP